MTKLKGGKPKCGKGQSCGSACIEASDQCSAKVDQAAADAIIAAVKSSGMAGLREFKQEALSSFTNAADKDLSVEQLAAKYPLKGFLKEQETDLGNGVSKWRVTVKAADKSGDAMSYDLVRFKDESYTVSDGRLKLVNQAGRGPDWYEAQLAAFRGLTYDPDKAKPEADVDWQQLPYVADPEGRDIVSANSVSYNGPSFGVQRELIRFMPSSLTGEKQGSALDGSAMQASPSAELRRAYERTLEGLGNLANATLEEDEERRAEAIAELTTGTDLLLAKISSSPGYAKPEKPREFYESKLKSEAVDWAKSQGFMPGGVNGFTADATAAHDIAHPATHRLTGLDSKAIHQGFGKMLDSSGKPSLLAEETLVNIVEHLSMGDTPEASIQNGLRLAKVLSRTQSKEAQAYVRSDPFAQAVIGITYDRIVTDSEYTSIMPVVRDSTFISGTVTTSGSDFSSSASGG